MPQTTQIVPEYGFPYVKTVINDNTQITEAQLNDEIVNPGVRYFYPFISSKGIDNKIVKINTQKDFVNTFGYSNFTKYGQPLMQAINTLSDSSSVVYALRVMPENATYAHNVITLAYKADLATNTFYIKLNQHHADTDSILSAYTVSDLKTFAKSVLPTINTDTSSVESWKNTQTEAETKRDETLKEINTIDSEAYDGVTLPTWIYKESEATKMDDEIADRLEDVPATASKIIISLQNGKLVPVEINDSDKVIKSEFSVEANSEISFDKLFNITISDGNATIKTVKDDESVNDESATTVALAELANVRFVVSISTTAGKTYYEVFKYEKVTEDHDTATYEYKDVDAITPVANTIYADILTHKVYGVRGVDGSLKVVGICELVAYYQDIVRVNQIQILQTEKAVDDEGYSVSPLAIMYSSGRGVYGNNYRVIANSDTAFEKDNDLKAYDFTIGTADNGFTQNAVYRGMAVPPIAIPSEAYWINDILANLSDGVAPVIINFDDTALDTVYEAYTLFVEQVSRDFTQSEINDSFDIKETARIAYKNAYDAFVIKYPILTESEIIDSSVQCRIPAWVETDEIDNFMAELSDVRTKYEVYRQAVSDYNETKASIQKILDGELPTKDQFDWLFGKSLNSNIDIPFVKVVGADDTTDTNIAYFNSSTGVPLFGGDDGYFSNPREVMVENVDEKTGKVTYTKKQWTLEDEVTDAYKKAWNGSLDPTILSTKRVPVDAFFDANYPLVVKSEMAKLVSARGEDALLYLDMGILGDYITQKELNTLIELYSGFASYFISKHFQSYTALEPSTAKRVQVTIPYFLSQIFSNHVANVGYNIPMVNAYCQLTGHTRNSLKPTIDDYMKDIKQSLVENKINYFETISDNVYRRQTQTTSQTVTSDLSEESNILIMVNAKRMVEDVLTAGFYDFTDGIVQTTLRKKVDLLFENWNNSIVQSVGISFAQSSYEQERGIIHCYMAITFRPLMKQAILEIDLNKREYNASYNITE